VSHVADHIEHVASITGRGHVGIASDFDGMYASVKGLESAEEYPNLVSVGFFFLARLFYDALLNC
jgi:membrane dipeptidase